ncbi:hypothetical protein TWF281_004604 [Arthrobotrys megalospora]
MLLPKLPVLASLLAITYAAPAPEAEKRATEHVDVARDVSQLPKRDQGSCWIHDAWAWTSNNQLRHYYLVQTWGQWDDDWGAGLLDNIRGKCDTPTRKGPYDWAFGYDPGTPPTWGHATFWMDEKGGTSSACIGDAVVAASWAWGAVYCQFDYNTNKWW